MKKKILIVNPRRIQYHVVDNVTKEVFIEEVEMEHLCIMMQEYLLRNGIVADLSVKVTTK